MIEQIERGRTAIFYYSFTGHTRKVAQRLQEEEGGDVYEIRERQPRSRGNAYTWGCYQAMKMEKVPIYPIECDYSSYDFFIVMVPIWAGYPAPALYSMLELLPKGARLEVIAVSGTGNSERGRPKAKSKIYGMDFDLVAFSDVQKDLYQFTKIGQQRQAKAREKEQARAARLAAKKAQKEAAPQQLSEHTADADPATAETNHEEA